MQRWRLRIGTPPRVIGEVGIVALATLLYFLVRGLVAGREAVAFANAAWLIDLERRLGVFWEPTIQEWALGVPHLDAAVNAVYIWGHWPVIAATLVWLLVAHREFVSLYRNAMLISGAIGLVCFVAMPMAPPRFLDAWGFVDTVTLQTNAYRVLPPPALTNQYAAMPSLHVGWNLLMGIAITRHAAPRLAKVFGLLMPVTMFAATVLTANHYILDGLVGSVVALIGLGGAWLMRRHPPRDRDGAVPPGARRSASCPRPQAPRLGNPVIGAYDGSHGASTRTEEHDETRHPHPAGRG